MERREFITKSMVAGSLILSGGLLGSSCKGDLRSELMNSQMDSIINFDQIQHMNQETYKILYYASLAPSGHNSQPWSVRLLSTTEWIIESDMNRRLSIVDADNREVMLSIGAFIENLVIAAGVFGFDAHVNVLAKNNFDRQVAKVILGKATPKKYPLHRIAMRRTVKSNMLLKELSRTDIRAFEEKVGSGLYYFPRGGEHAAFMEKEAIDNFKIQAENDKAQEELSKWIRFKNSNIEKYRDGLTARSMEINGIAGWYVRTFMKQKDVISDSFRQKGIEKTIEQAGQGAGWIVITSDGNKTADLIDTGRRFQKMALIARERNIAIHPMTQTIEEKHGQANIKANHKPETMPQFMLRVGYVNKYPNPVTLRRPVKWFVKT
jgi:nitroreductase